MGMVSAYETFERQAKEIFADEVYDRAPDLLDALTVEAKIMEDTQLPTFEVTFRCRDTLHRYVTSVQRRMGAISDDPYYSDNAKDILEWVKELLRGYSVAELYAIFLGRFWVARMVSHFDIQDTLNGLQAMGYFQPSP